MEPIFAFAFGFMLFHLLDGIYDVIDILREKKVSTR